MKNKLKRYADEKMDALKDDSFKQALEDEHFGKEKKRPTLRRSVIAAVALVVVICIVSIVVTVTVFGSMSYNAAAPFRQATVEELNAACDRFEFADGASVVMERDATTGKASCFFAEYASKDRGVMNFYCVVDEDIECSFETYENSVDFGGYTLRYRLSSSYDEENGVYEHTAYATLLTDAERISISYQCSYALQNNAFLDLLRTLLTPKA